MTTTTRRPTIRLLALGLTVAGALSLAACGSSSSAEPAQTESAAPGPGGFGGADMQKIFACLKAAGIDVPDLPSGMPSGRSSGMPSDRPSGARPSGAPSDFRGRGGIDFSDAKVAAALKACGITVPSGMPAPQASS